MNHPITDDDLIDLLKQIRALALSPYPWPANAPPNDDFLVLTLGRIAGMAEAAFAAIDRPARHLRLVDEGTGSP